VGKGKGGRGGKQVRFNNLKREKNLIIPPLPEKSEKKRCTPYSNIRRKGERRGTMKEAGVGEWEKKEGGKGGKTE